MNNRMFNPPVFNMLPEIIQRAVNLFSKDTEKHVLAISAIASLGSIFPSVSGTYDGKEVFSNLFAFISAGQGSGKGVAPHGVSLTSKVHQHRRQIPVAYYDPANKGKPEKCMLRIPANTSSAAFLQIMKENEEHGNLMADTEADTITSILGEKWGAAMSSNLRKSFHHEELSISRKTNNVYLETIKSRLSLLLTGTPDQLLGMIKSFQNGLMSRFIFFHFQSDKKWKDVSPSGQPSLKGIFEELAEEIYQIYLFYLDRPVEFTLSDEDWKDFNEQWQKILDEHTAAYGNIAEPFVKRAGLIAFRIAMIFTILNDYKEGVKQNKIVGDKRDLDASIYLAEFFVINLLEFEKANRNAVLSKQSKFQAFLGALPLEFERKDITHLGQMLGICPRTVDNYLDRGVDIGFLIWEKQGNCKKAET